MEQLAELSSNRQNFRHTPSSIHLLKNVKKTVISKKNFKFLSFYLQTTSAKKNK